MHERGGIFNQQDGLWRVNNRIAVPLALTDFRQCLIAMAHNGLGGHLGIYSTNHVVAAYVYWPAMTHEISTFVKGCIDCNEKRDRPFQITW